MKNRGELRIPLRLLKSVVAKKHIKLLRLLATAKLCGHRCKIGVLRKLIRLNDRTFRRMISKLVSMGWAGYDGVYIFPRSWRRLGLNKRRGLYLVDVPKNLVRFEALCFTLALKEICRRRGSQHLEIGKVEQTDFPARYLSKTLEVSERRFQRLKAASQKYKLISVTRQFMIVGAANEVSSLKKNLKDVSVFVRGTTAVAPIPSRIQFNV